MMIKRLTKGLNVSLVQQQDEDYCDDVNFFGERLSDLVLIDNIFTKFENISGAILSRSKKSKVMGLGAWRGRQVWPLQWLKVVDEAKIFGFVVFPTYKLTLQHSWEACLIGFRKTIMSWKARQLNNLSQKIQVLKIFVTSKLWYMASALPLPEKFAKKFETMMGSFLWVGRLERLQIDEVKNSLSDGGLGLPCVSSKACSLFLKQTCRILMDPDSKQYGHVKYWLGLHIREFFPVMAVGPHAEFVGPYFQHMRLLLVEALTLGDIKLDSFRSVTAKKLYEGYTSTFPPPKVIYKYDVDWPLVWERLGAVSLDPLPKEHLFSIVHNIVPNRDRLFRKMNLVNSPHCMVCGVIEDNVHIFTECVLVREAWGWLRMRLLDLLPQDCALTSNFEFINLMFVKHFWDKEIIWLLGSYIELAWAEKFQKKRKVKLNHLIGHLKLRYQANQVSRKPLLGYIANIS